MHLCNQLFRNNPDNSLRQPDDRVEPDGDHIRNSHGLHVERARLEQQCALKKFLIIVIKLANHNLLDRFVLSVDFSIVNGFL